MGVRIYIHVHVARSEVITMVYTSTNHPAIIISYFTIIITVHHNFTFYAKNATMGEKWR